IPKNPSILDVGVFYCLKENGCPCHKAVRHVLPPPLNSAMPSVLDSIEFYNWLIYKIKMPLEHILLLFR
ncbi:MAG: hypothetical protein KA296_11330, partial [Marinobacter sp.]|nr:hypothetical protein [Marinobacter sp.]